MGGPRRFWAAHEGGGCETVADYSTISVEDEWARIWIGEPADAGRRSARVSRGVVPWSHFTELSVDRWVGGDLLVHLPDRSLENVKQIWPLTVEYLT